MKRGICAVCGIVKNQFIKTPKGGSLLNKRINNLPVEMHLPGANFCGPGTKLKQRLNPDLTLKNGVNLLIVLIRLVTIMTFVI